MGAQMQREAYSRVPGLRRRNAQLRWAMRGQDPLKEQRVPRCARREPCARRHPAASGDIGWIGATRKKEAGGGRLSIAAVEERPFRPCT